MGLNKIQHTFWWIEPRRWKLVLLDKPGNLNRMISIINHMTTALKGEKLYFIGVLDSNMAMSVFSGRDMKGPSLVLKKGCLCQAMLWYTPLVEVNQAIFAWSCRQLLRETARGPIPNGNEIHFNQVKSDVATSHHPVIGDYVGGLSSVLQRALPRQEPRSPMFYLLVIGNF